MTDSSSSPPKSSPPWLLRVPEVFSPFAGEILRELGAASPRKLGKEYHLTSLADPDHAWAADAAVCVRWRLPVRHAWPCRPLEMEDFVEKAARGLERRFAGDTPQTILCGPLQAGGTHPRYRGLAVALRGRALQLFPGARAVPADDQDPEKPTLYCLLGQEGLFAGIATPRRANGFHPGGTRFIRQSGEGTISRAGAKIAEALHYLRLHRPEPPAGSHWLELGASPGGMTSELLDRGYRVTAVDRAPLDARLRGRDGLDFRRADVADFAPPAGLAYDALLSDMNGDARQSFRHLVRLSSRLRPGGLIVFTLKTPGVSSLDGLVRLRSEVMTLAAKSSLRLVAATHLTYNRQEFTMFFGKE